MRKLSSGWYEFDNKWQVWKSGNVWLVLTPEGNVADALCTLREAREVYE